MNTSDDDPPIDPQPGDNVIDVPPLSDDDWRLVRPGQTAPRDGGHGSWVETDHPAVVACMGSAPPCVEHGCQYQRIAAERDALLARVKALENRR